MRIQNNITADNSHRQYGINVSSQSKNMEKLSSGYRVNRAADDAAGLAISEKMRTQIRGLSQAANNIQDGCSLLQVADAAMQSASDIIQRMRELAVQSANGTNDDKIDREALDLEYQELMKELDEIANKTDFNGIRPLMGYGAQNPSLSSLGGRGISSPSVTATNPGYGGPGFDPLPDPSDPYTPPADFVSNGVTISQVPPTATAPSYVEGTHGTIVGSKLTVTATCNIATLPPGVTEIELGSGATLVVGSAISQNLSISGPGQARFNGGITGDITVALGSKVTVINGATGKVTNNGTMTINGTTNGVINNGDMHITSGAGIAADVASNTGNLYISGSNSKVTNNSGHLTFSGGTPHLITNANSGVVVFSGNNAPKVGDTGIENSGNHGTMYIYADGLIDVTTNTGDLLIITIEGEPATPKIGTNTGKAQIDGDTAQIGTNSGQLLINGNGAKIETNTARGQVRINGNGPASLPAYPGPYTQADAVIESNLGTAHIEGNNILIWENSRTVFVAGTPVVINDNLANSQAMINGNNAVIMTNRGSAVTTGVGTTVQNNMQGSGIRFVGDTDARVMVNNGGRIEIPAGSTLRSLILNTSNGTILVQGTFNVPTADNEGRIEVASGGSLTMGNNRGTIEIGDSRTAPRDGDPSVTAIITGSNEGLIRNFSVNLLVNNSGAGQVDNYGTIDPASTIPNPANLRHHVRDADTDGIVSGAEGTQTITIYVNGKAVTLTGEWDGETLEFPSADDPLPYPFDGGSIIFDAIGKYASIPNTRYDVQPRVTIPDGRGASGTGLIFSIYKGFYIQSGANEGDATELSFRPMGVRYLAMDEDDDSINLGATDILTMESASNALTMTWQAINDVSIYRAELGAQYNRLEYTYANVTNSTENIAAAESRIRDADMAKEMTHFTKNSILQQSSTAMLAQANALPQGVLQLLG